VLSVDNGRVKECSRRARYGDGCIYRRGKPGVTAENFAAERAVSTASRLSGTEIHHMHVGAETNVIGQIPTRIVRVNVDNDVVGVPQPIRAVVNIVGRDAEEEPAELEARWAAACQAVDVTAADVSWEMAVLPRMVEVIVRVRAAANPLAGAGMNVRCGGMVGLITKSGMWSVLRLMRGRRWPTGMRRPVSRDVSAANRLAFLWRAGRWVRGLPSLRGKSAERAQQQRCCDSDEFFHDTPPSLAPHTIRILFAESRIFLLSIGPK
jgi:hypothetical protein